MTTPKKTKRKKSMLQVISRKYRFYLCTNCKKPFHRKRNTPRGAPCRYCGAK